MNISAEPEASPEAGLADLVAKLAAVLKQSHYPAGDLAALRRWAPSRPSPLAFYRLWLRHLGDELPADHHLPAWTALAWGLALAGPASHRKGRSLGQALWEAGFSEARLERLLAAPEDVRLDLFLSMVRFLAAKGESFDWTDAAALLLAANPEKRERIHRHIAKSFYRCQFRKKA